MCSSKLKLQETGSFDINGRPVLQPTCNRVPLLERRNLLKKNFTKSVITPKIPPSTMTTTTNVSPKLRPSVITPPISPKRKSPRQPVTVITPPISPKPKSPRQPATVITPPISPKPKSPRQPATKQGNDPNGLSSSAEKVVLTPRSTNKVVTPVKKSKAIAPSVDTTTLNYSSSSIAEAPGSIAAARRQQVATMQVQRKSKIAHYGRTKSARFEPKIVPLDDATTTAPEEKRCSFITSNSDPIYVAYHDEEWGVPAHDDRLLFELLVLIGAQVGSDWTSVLRKRQEFRDAFSAFDAETVSKFSEKKITSISTKYSIAVSQVRGIVDNSIRILQMKKDFGSFAKYLWGFVNHKPIVTQYKSSHKMPAKTSKAESISKDMVKKGFRLVGPTVIHSFMQAAGFTNDHLITCPQHLQCLALASHTGTSAAPAPEEFMI